MWASDILATSDASDDEGTSATPDASSFFLALVLHLSSGEPFVAQHSCGCRASVPAAGPG